MTGEAGAPKSPNWKIMVNYFRNQGVYVCFIILIYLEPYRVPLSANLMKTLGMGIII